MIDQQVGNICQKIFFLTLFTLVERITPVSLLKKVFFLPDVVNGINLDSISNLLWFLECFNFNESFGYIINITITFFAISLIYHIKK